MRVQKTQRLSCQQEGANVGALLVRASSVRATQRMHERCGMCILRCRAAEVTETRTVRSLLEFRECSVLYVLVWLCVWVRVRACVCVLVRVCAVCVCA